MLWTNHRIFTTFVVSMNQIVYRFRSHLIFWCIFITYEVGLIFSYTGSISSIPDYLVHYSLNICLFYANTHLILNKYLSANKKTYLIIAPLVFLQFVIYLVLKYAMVKFLIYQSVELTRPYVSFKIFLTESVWRAIYMIGLSTAYWSGLAAIRQQKIISELEVQRLQDQLDKQRLENVYLQSQINPHFLFNTLTFLYTSVNRISEKVADSVLLLADVMRYSLKRPNEDGKTCIAEEIEHIQNFIELNQAQTDYPLQLDFQAEGDYKNLRILPLVMLTLVENVFKYGDLKNPEDPAKIYIQIQGKELSMYICNKVKASHRGHSHGLGMENVIKRLDNYYNGRYILNVNTKENHYYLNLAITL